MTGTLKLLIQGIPGEGTPQVGAIVDNAHIAQRLIVFHSQVGGLPCQARNQGTSSGGICQDLAGGDGVTQFVF